MLNLHEDTTERTPLKEEKKSMTLPIKLSSLSRWQVSRGSKTHGSNFSTKAGLSEVTLEFVGI